MATSRIKNIVLLGLGHTHAHVVKQWANKPLPNSQLIAITNFPRATYSGMLPGVLAGDYREDQMQIDLVRLCKAAGVRLILDEVADIDRDSRTLYFHSGRQLGYSLLSVAVGSQPPLPNVADDSNMSVQIDASDIPEIVSIKPMQTLLSRLTRGLTAAKENVDHESTTANPRPIQIDIVGGGLGSLEIALCLPNWLRENKLQESDYQLRIISGSDDPPEGCITSTRRKIQTILKHRSVTLLTGGYLENVSPGLQLHLRDGQTLQSDLVIYVGAGKASPVTRQLGLTLDDRDCIVTNQYLRSIDDPQIWAAGDCGSIQDLNVPKAGVYAVRQGPVIWENLERWSAGNPTIAYDPQKDFLKLINTGNQSAIGQWKGFSFSGKWVWHWKDRIDRKFMQMYQALATGKMNLGQRNTDLSMTNTPSQSAHEDSTTAMRCLGCGGKVGGQMLRETLGKLEKTERTAINNTATDRFVVLDSKRLQDDVAIWENQLGGATAVSVDTMADPLNDPFLFGRIAVLHALSDLWASGVKPQRITLSVELPIQLGNPASSLLEVMSGVVNCLRQHRVELLGGHTLEGPRLSLSVTAFGQLESKQIPFPKQGMNDGDVLIYTKSLGIGIALAASMRNQCSAETWQATLQQLQIPNSIALQLSGTVSVHAATDVTGFGLAGHLHEMAGDREIQVKLNVPQLLDNLIPGIPELIHQGFQSSIAPSNRGYLPITARENPIATAALVDPQTSGGLLVAVPRDQVEQCLKLLTNDNAAENGQRPWIIGEIHNRTTEQPWLEFLT